MTRLEYQTDFNHHEDEAAYLKIEGDSTDIKIEIKAGWSDGKITLNLDELESINIMVERYKNASLAMMGEKA